MLVRYPLLEQYINRYENDAALHMEPLTITIHLRPGAQLAGYDPLNLDNLLARAVVDEATQGRGLPNSREPYWLPVPLQCLWRSPEGLPLWASSVFRPVGPEIKDTFYWHKRQQKGEFTRAKSGRFAPRSTQGRWMERRVPLPALVVERLEATCCGNREEITRLLAGLDFIGKRRAIGFGEVAQITVASAAAFSLVQAGRLVRPFPALALELLDGQLPQGSAAPVGWTPPQWKPSLFAVGWWAGTPVGEFRPLDIDYFGGPDGLRP